MKRWMCMLLVMLVFGTSTAWAGQWEQTEDGAWRYEEDGTYAKGWQQIDGIWYYMNPENGLWDAKPALSETAACHLLENAVSRAGWYAKKDYPIHYNVTGTTKNTYTIALQMETAPMVWTETLNIFEINRKTGQAKSISTKLVLDLYE